MPPNGNVNTGPNPQAPPTPPQSGVAAGAVSAVQNASGQVLQQNQPAGNPGQPAENPGQPASANPQSQAEKPKKARKKINLQANIDLNTIKQFIKSKKKEKTAETTGNFEINLVPDIKGEMIRTLKLRNLVFFICLVVSAAALGGVGMLWSVVAGQNLIMSNQDNKLAIMSNKLNSYSSLGEFITIQDQMAKISTINENRKVLSRVFMVMDAMRPKGADEVKYSSVNVTMATSTLNFEAQADAGEEPLIDYRVLESYKKNSQQMRYDYGRYVTDQGTEIPTRCIQEADEAGNAYIREGRYFAIWTRGVAGCDPDLVEEEEEDSDTAENSSATGNSSASGTNSNANNTSSTSGTANSSTNTSNTTNSNLPGTNLNTNDINSYSNDNTLNTETNLATNAAETEVPAEDTPPEEVDIYALNEEIYRTPVIATGGGEWYEKGYIDENGYIEGVPHFESQCIEYTATGTGKSLRWTATNSCMLSEEGVVVTSSSNAKSDGASLVLRFSATITLSEDILDFTKKHVMIISPTSQNVTDSYVQVEGMFVKPAEECEEGDESCDDLLNSTGVEE